MVQGEQSSTGLSLTAMVVKEEDREMLRLGPVPRCKGAICGINEINRMNYSDQAQLLDPMQEGNISMAKYGIPAEIRSSTTIFASANPLTGDWQDDMVDLNQINVIQPLLDRFDLKFILKRNKDQDKIREYAALKSKFLVTDSKDPLQKEIESSNTKFLQKYLMYAKQKFDPEITAEAESMISEYYVKVAANSPISSRALETIYNLAIARAKLKLRMR